MKWNQKPCITSKKMIDRRKRSKTLSEVKVKLVKNISKNPQSFLEISHMQKEVLLSHKVQECQESLIQGKIPFQQNWNESLKYL